MEETHKIIPVPLFPTIQSELKKLLALDLVVKRRDGNRLYYRANTDHPLYPDIRSIVLKTVGLVEILREALEHDGKIVVAFVFGSMATERGNARSDVDLVVIGDAGPRDVPAMLSDAADKIGREINPIVLTQAEFAKRLKNQDHFIGRIMEGPKLYILGGENDLAAMDR